METLEVINVHPGAGESQASLASPTSQSVIEDYAIVRPGARMDPTRSMLIRAGNTTVGTQQRRSMFAADSLASCCNVWCFDPGELKPFEALLRVKVTTGFLWKADPWPCAPKAIAG